MGWSLRSDTIQATSAKEILSWVIDPHLVGKNDQLKYHYSLCWALTRETIWNTRNKVLHDNETFNFATVLRGLEHRVIEYQELGSSSPRVYSLVEPFVWRPSPSGFIKLNVDAAVSLSRTTLAMVVRNDKGEILKFCAKACCCEVPVVAEAKVVLWALQMTKEEDYQMVLVEGDAKTVMDSLQSPLSPVDWTISTIARDVQTLSSYFLNCDFQWTRREGNNLAHTIAQFIYLFFLIFFLYPWVSGPAYAYLD